VEVVLTADGPDTVVELFHHDLPAEDFDGHLSGWRAMLDRLVQACAGRHTAADHLRALLGLQQAV